MPERDQSEAGRRADEERRQLVWQMCQQLHDLPRLVSVFSLYRYACLPGYTRGDRGIATAAATGTPIPDSPCLMLLC